MNEEIVNKFVTTALLKKSWQKLKLKAVGVVNKYQDF